MNNTADLADVARRLCVTIDADFIEPLGNGAFKQVFLIEKVGQRLALKISTISEGLQPRFEREVAALRECDHSAITKIFDCWAYKEVETIYWVTTEEYLPGGTLSVRQRAGAIPVHEIRNIGLTLAHALAHLDSKNLVHRDIKPANILFRSSNEPVLTDFGLVRMLDASSLTEDFVFQGPGTPFYSAPEQLNNNKTAIDWRTDQFGLAVVLAECALNYHPYFCSGMTRQEIVQSVAEYRNIPERTVHDLTSIGLAALIRALQPWPISRYRWPSDFINALSGSENGRISSNGP
ncbi:serine/threonine protein kinase [Burkholderia contaminans]|uniref:serine/threonine protein kinase n=1 Tax=Burkholderia contaminans TaxID=488447 RepID=UPI00158B3626|nr:serine/threonine-protein kinase [Burkholderia contaminans]